MGGGPRARVAAGRTRWQRPAHTASGPGPGRRAQSPFGQFAGPRPATRCRERSGSGGNIFAPCMISGPSTRKGGLDGRIRAPCIPNRPIAPGNGRIRRGSCHFDLEKHAFRADIAREGGLFRAFGEKGMHTARFLPARAPLPPQREGRGRGRRAVGAMRMGRAARWARCRCGRGRGGMGAIWAGPQRDDPDDDSGPARYRHGETRVAAGQRAGDGLSKRGRRNGAETEGHAGAWAQWSRAARCRRCDEGQCSAEIAVGAGGAVGAASAWTRWPGRG